jgi:hypothetical protein
VLLPWGWLCKVLNIAVGLSLGNGFAKPTGREHLHSREALASFLIKKNKKEMRLKPLENCITATVG